MATGCAGMEGSACVEHGGKALINHLPVHGPQLTSHGIGTLWTVAYGTVQYAASERPAMLGRATASECRDHALHLRVNTT